MTDFQLLKTDGEDLVVLTRRDFEALLARAGDPSAEDLMTTRIIVETQGQKALPGEVMDRILDGENPVLVLLKHSGMTQAELSARTGLSQPFISKLTRGETTPGPKSLQPLAQAFGVSEDVLLFDHEG